MRDISQIRGDFPALQQEIHGKPLIYFDNAATSQKPQLVIDALVHYYSRDNANVHRGVHALSERATAAYEGARATIQAFINAEHEHEIIYTRGTTDAINLVASSFGQRFIQTGDEILISTMEHHSNIVPWQLLCERTGAVLKVVTVTDDGELDLDDFAQKISEKTKLVAMVHISNSLGTVNPVEDVIEMAHRYGAAVLLDGAQAVPHQPVDVQALNCDFYAFSAHKMFGPTGFGVLYGKSKWLEKMPPYQGGGDMIRLVSFAGTTYNDLPYKFEAGTPHIAGAVGTAAAIKYIKQIGYEAIQRQEAELLAYGTRTLQDIPGLRLVGTAEHKAAVLSFVLDDAHPHDISTILDQQGIAIRAGHHCTQPLMEHFGIAATARASLAFYNTVEELDCLRDALLKTVRLLAA